MWQTRQSAQTCTRDILDSFRAGEMDEIFYFFLRELGPGPSGPQNAGIFQRERAVWP
jgi:hypothetical protein